MAAQDSRIWLSADKSYKLGNYELAIALYSDAFAKHPAKIDLDRLNRRATCYEILKKYDRAYEDAEAMFTRFPRRPEGYLRAGKVCQLAGRFNKAHGIYVRGLNAVDRNSKHYALLAEMRDSVRARIRHVAGPGHAKTHDMMSVLPSEVIQMTLLYLPFRQRVRLQQVSKSWRMFVQTCPPLWADLDFRKCNKKAKVTTKSLEQYLGRSKGMLAELYLYNLTSFNATRFLPTFQKALANGRLQVLQFDPDYRFITATPLPDLDFSSLRVLRVNTKLIGTVMPYVCRAHLPSLRILHFYKSDESLQTKTDLAFEKCRLPVETLIIDASGSAKIVPLTQAQKFVDFLSCFPQLMNLTLLNIHVSPDQGDINFDLNDTNPRLVSVDLTYSGVRPMPILPPTCEKFIARQSSALPKPIAGAPGTPVYLPSETPVLHNEFDSLTHLDFSRCARLSGALLLGDLGRCRRLRRLELEECPNLQASDMQAIVRACPSLRVLNVYNCAWFTDAAMHALHDLRDLKYLDVSRTQVTVLGVLLMFAGSDLAPDGKKRLPLMTLVQQIADDAAAGNAPGLQHLVIDNCFAIGKQTVEWIQSLGIHVDHDGTSTYELTRRKTPKVIPIDCK